MKAKMIVSAILIFLFGALLSSAQTLHCSDIKNGVFVSFSIADGSRTTYTRNGECKGNLIPPRTRQLPGMLNG